MSIETTTDPVTGLKTVASASTGSGLAATFKNQIETIMTYEGQSLELLKKERDELTKRMESYETLGEHLEEFYNATQALISSGGYSDLGYSRMATVTAFDSDYTVATIDAGSAAIKGTYQLSVTSLATSYIHMSDQQSSSSAALGLTGNLWIGGDGTASATEGTDTGNHINSVSTSTVDTDFNELGRDTYTLETRDNNGTLQFRLVDANGDAVEIADQDDASTLTAGWQDVTAGSYDTGRGLTIDFTGTGTAGDSATIDYVSAGRTVTVSEDDSLIAIANKINDLQQPEGREITATVLNNQLVLSGPTGAGNNIDYVDGVGLGLAQTQAGTDAVFSVNGVNMTRESNTGLSDVIAGLTINFDADAEGQTATIEVTQDTSAAEEAIDEFVEAFNQLVKFINEETAINMEEDGTYSRESLGSDTIFSDLRSSLYDILLTSFSDSGQFSSLAELGLGFDDDLVLSVTDSDKLESALESNYDGVLSLFENVMGAVEHKTSSFAGSTGYVETMYSSLDTEWTDMSETILDMQEVLMARKEQLTNTYARMQQTVLEMQYTYQSWASIFSNTQSMLGSG
jgi:flagellar hook-associated protein 2